MSAASLGRRGLLQATALASLGLVIGCHVEPPPQSAAAPPTPGPTPPPPAHTATPAVFAPNAWVRVATDGTVTVIIDKAEMGQGIQTGIAILVAEELECDLPKVRTEFAPVDAKYVNPLFGLQATGGSTSVMGGWEPLRKAGAAARMMLVAAAAKSWGVDASACKAERGEVVHVPSGKRASYGSLAEAASKIPVPTDIPLKPRASCHLVGTRVPRLDADDKARGKTQFGIDTQLPGMLVAVVARPGAFGSKMVKVDKSRAEKMPGVRRVVPIDSGVAVVADGYYNARQAASALQIEWSKVDGFTSETLEAKAAALAKGPGLVAETKGDVERALGKAAKKIEATYHVPFQAHATMEPMACTASVTATSCEIWAPTQFPFGTSKVAEKVTGLAPSAITVHTTFLGGGFGRRFEVDFVAEAVVLSKEMQAPVKVVWSREDDLRHDFYRPASYNVLRGGLGKDGAPVAWAHRAVSDSIFTRVFPQMLGKNGLDNAGVEGAIDLPYAIPDVQVDWHKLDSGVPVGFWRSVGHSMNAFVTECFLDELAHLAGQDPLEYRKRLMTGKDPKVTRLRAAMELAASKADWGKPLGKGRGRGIAVAASFGSFVAQVAEVTVDAKGGVRVDRVVCAIDCGSVVNVDQVEAQMESAIAFGLTATLKSEITMAGGGVKQGSFGEYKLLPIGEMPKVEVFIVPSEDKPGGAGEPGTPPIAPAVVNAVFAATGKRVRRLPIRAEDLRKA